MAATPVTIFEAEARKFAQLVVPTLFKGKRRLQIELHLSRADLEALCAACYAAGCERVAGGK